MNIKHIAKSIDNVNKQYDSTEEAIEAVQGSIPANAVRMNDACQGDLIVWIESEFSGSYRKPKYDGSYARIGMITSDSYGAGKQQHTFSIDMFSDGGAIRKTRRKGRNIYRNACWILNADRADRSIALDDKHTRGSEARADREFRKSFECGRL